MLHFPKHKNSSQKVAKSTVQAPTEDLNDS